MDIKPFAFYTTFLLLAISHCFGQAPEREQKPVTKEIETLIDSLGNALNRWYVYPGKAALMMGSVINNFKNGAYNNKDRAELSRQLNIDLQKAYKDAHLEIAYDPQLARELETYVPDTASNRQAYEKDLHDAKENNFAFKKAEILPGNIGYIRWDGFYDFVDEAMPTVNGAFQFVKNTNTLIIDMRNNGGGSPEMVLQTQSYFFHQKTPMNYIIDRNNDTLKRWADPAKTDFKLTMPVYILTSRGTFSGAEDFTYGLKYAKRATVVGDTTGGGAHPTRPFSIGQGFVAFIPTHRSTNIVTQTDWDGTGVWPDVPVPSDQALAKAEALAYTELILKATDEREKNMLRWNLTSTENKALVTKQIKYASIEISKEELLKYCGEYNAADPNQPSNAIYIVLNGNYLARRVSVGAEDVRLIPIADNKFAYDDDDSGRTIEFITTNKDGQAGMILSTQNGVFKLNKKR